jgi:hypothetical protein
MKMMERQEKNRSIDRGIGMIGASLAQEQNRAGIMQAFSSDNNADPNVMINNIMAFKQSQNALQQKAAERAGIPAIAAKYGLSAETANYLFDAGKLDQVIAEAEKPNNEIVSNEDGTHVIVDKTTGQISQPFGVAKKREIELVDDPVTGGKIAVYKDDKSPVGNNNIAGTGNTEQEQLYNAAMRGVSAEKRIPLEQWLLDQKRAGASQVNVGPSGTDYGDPPKDTAWKRAPDGSIVLDERGVPIALPVQGGTVFIANEEAANKIEGSKKASDATADIVTEDIDRVLDIINDKKNTGLFSATGVPAAASQIIPGTPAYNAKALVETVKANVGFDKLQAMRAASPTGAALGPVSDFENKLLQAVIGNLELAQSKDQVVYNLDRVKRIYSAIVSTGIKSQEEADGLMQKPSSSSTNMSVDDIIKLYSKE